MNKVRFLKILKFTFLKVFNPKCLIFRCVRHIKFQSELRVVGERPKKSFHNLRKPHKNVNALSSAAVLLPC